MWERLVEIEAATSRLGEEAEAWLVTELRLVTTSRGLWAPNPPGGAGGGGASFPEVPVGDGREAGLPSPDVCW